MAVFIVYPVSPAPLSPADNTKALGHIIIAKLLAFKRFADKLITSALSVYNFAKNDAKGITKTNPNVTIQKVAKLFKYINTFFAPSISSLPTYCPTNVVTAIVKEFPITFGI